MSPITNTNDTIVKLVVTEFWAFR